MSARKGENDKTRKRRVDQFFDKKYKIIWIDYCSTTNKTQGKRRMSLKCRLSHANQPKTDGRQRKRQLLKKQFRE